MNQEKTFDAAELLAELDGGVFNQQFSQALRDVAEGAMAHGREGKVVLELKVKRIDGSVQVSCAHKLAYVKPTMRGKSTEELTTQTPLYVGQRGRLTIMPDNQEAFQFGERRAQEESGQ